MQVLEFLALKEILTPEHINKGPPCSGMERLEASFIRMFSVVLLAVCIDLEWFCIIQWHCIRVYLVQIMKLVYDA